jgi:uncharacterized protein
MSDWNQTFQGIPNPDHAWIETFTGKQFFPLQPRVEDVDIRDIAHGLSMTCRFTGQCLCFLSVAEHSLRVSEQVEQNGMWPKLGLIGLLHDAPEAYICDLSRPLKHHTQMGNFYLNVERTLANVIEQKFDLPLGSFERQEIKDADLDALLLEKYWNMRSGESEISPATASACCPLRRFSPEQAEERFLSRFYDLRRRAAL